MFSIFYYTDVFQLHPHTHIYTSNLGLNTMLKEYKISEERQKSTVSEEVCVAAFALPGFQFWLEVFV